MVSARVKVTLTGYRGALTSYDAIVGKLAERASKGDLEAAELIFELMKYAGLLPEN